MSYSKGSAEKGVDDELLKKANEGNNVAQYLVAMKFRREGKNGEAAEYFRRAVDNGPDDAPYEYGRCLLNGWGVPIDLTAAEYFKLAADQG